MNRAECLAALKVMRTAWPNNSMAKEQVDFYIEGIIDLDAGGMLAVIKSLSKTEEFLPSIAKLRRRYYNLCGMGNPEAAWEQLDRIVKEPSVDIHWQDREGLDPIGVAALVSLGGMPELRFSDRPEFLRGEFIRAYERRYVEELAEPKVSARLLELGPAGISGQLGGGGQKELGAGEKE